MVKDKRKSLREGPFFQTFIYDHKKSFFYLTMYSLAARYGFSFDEPFENLPGYAKEIIFYGAKGEKFPLIQPEGYDKELTRSFGVKIGDFIEFEGLVTKLDRLYKECKHAELAEWQENLFNTYMIDEVCPYCKGTRLKPQREWIALNGCSYHQLGNMEFSALLSFLDEITIPPEKKNAVLPIINEIKLKLKSFTGIGLGYLFLNRRTDTLSGGEYQRIRLAGQIGSGLIGLTYIIDEPTVGLHGVDTMKIVDYLNRLCAQGNTVITIEHDPDIIKNADYIIEIGPGAGVNGGEIVSQGGGDSVISSILNGRVPFTRERKILDGRTDFIRIIGAKANNLKKIDVTIPLNMLVCFTGVSGSGKSSLVIEILFKALWSSLHDARMIPGKHERIEGMEKIRGIYCIDQSPISKTKVSIPATYIGVFDAIRQAFAQCAGAERCGLNHISHYSFNSAGGCPSCKGAGYLDTHIHYLGDVKVDCPLCGGKRYADEVLEVYYKGRNIAQVLEMTIEDAVTFFEDTPYIFDKLKYLHKLGLGYMKLGQSLNTISGGEAQRLRLAREISKTRGTKNMLYILDEPTAGLHSKDIQKLLRVFTELIDAGNSVVLIEHNPDVILFADHIIGVGPEAGSKGGEIVAQGAPEDIIACERSHTGRYLKMIVTD